MKMIRQIDSIMTWWGNQELELQQWEDCMKSKNTRILAIVMLVPNRNPPGYKEHVISFITISFRDGVTIIYWLINMKVCVQFCRII